ncbi:MAG: segregation and condensation protein A [bacterium]
MTEETIVRLEPFEGPLELLLYLVRKHELDVFDIPIAQLTDDYLTFLRTTDILNLDAASDFLIMAAVLLRIKIRALLPRPPEEDLSTPQVTLEQILESYRSFQQAARILAKKEDQQRQRFPRQGESPPPQLTESEDITLLARAFSRLLARLKPPTKVSIPNPQVKVADKLIVLRTLLREKECLTFEEAVTGATLLDLIVTFLALLELVRLGEISVKQEFAFAPILIRRQMLDSCQ